MTISRLSTIPAEAASDTRLSNLDVRILTIIGREGGKGFVQINRAEIARMANCAESSVPRSIRKSEGLGYLERLAQSDEAGRSTANKYRVKLDQPVEGVTQDTRILKDTLAEKLPVSSKIPPTSAAGANDQPQDFGGIRRAEGIAQDTPKTLTKEKSPDPLKKTTSSPSLRSGEESSALSNSEITSGAAPPSRTKPGNGKLPGLDDLPKAKGRAYVGDDERAKRVYDAVRTSGVLHEAVRARFRPKNAQALLTPLVRLFGEDTVLEAALGYYRRIKREDGGKFALALHGLCECGKLEELITDATVAKDEAAAQASEEITIDLAIKRLRSGVWREPWGDRNAPIYAQAQAAMAQQQHRSAA